MMINSKGETIYTNAEVGYELGLAPATINAIGKRLYGGGRVSHWTLTEVERIVEYIKSISVDEDAKRLNALHDVVEKVMGGKRFDESEVKERFNKDLYNVC